MNAAEWAAPGGIGLFGRGRLGRAVVSSATEREIEVAWQAGRGEVPGEGGSVVIDASLGEAVREHLEWAVERGLPVVIAATGWQGGSWVERAGQRIGVLVAPNGSLTVALFGRWARMLGAYAAQLPEAGLFLLDHHHEAKRDAPSGTANHLLGALEEGFRQSGGTLPVISTAAIRAGHEVGCHRLGLDTPGETLEISHRARSRAAFAQGLLTAALWLRGRRGVFSMDDVAADVLGPLVSNPGALHGLADAAASHSSTIPNAGERS